MRQIANFNRVPIGKVRRFFARRGNAQLPGKLIHFGEFRECFANEIELYQYARVSQPLPHRDGPVSRRVPRYGFKRAPLEQYSLLSIRWPHSSDLEGTNADQVRHRGAVGKPVAIRRAVYHVGAYRNCRRFVWRRRVVIARAESGWLGRCRGRWSRGGLRLVSWDANFPPIFIE